MTGASVGTGNGDAANSADGVADGSEDGSGVVATGATGDVTGASKY